MKRLWIAAAIILVLTTACIVSANDVKYSCSQLIDTLSAAQQAVEDDELELAVEKTKEFREQWSQWSPVGNMYILHSELEPIHQLSIAMEEYLKDGSIVHYSAANRQIAGILEHIVQTEMPSFANIL